MKIITIAWLIMMVYLSHVPGPSTIKHSHALSNITGFDEHFLRTYAHFVLFFILGLLATLVWGFSLILCIILMFIGFLDEYSKKLVKGRHFTLYEAILNIVGALSGAYLLNIIMWIL